LLQLGITALHLAALNGHPEVVDVLLSLGAAVDDRNEVRAPLEVAEGS
jgi:ankyrin repeat protein